MTGNPCQPGKMSALPLKSHSCRHLFLTSLLRAKNVVVVFFFVAQLKLGTNLDSQICFCLMLVFC